MGMFFAQNIQEKKKNLKPTLKLSLYSTVQKTYRHVCVYLKKKKKKKKKKKTILHF